jgi:hypothetical protein
VAVAQNPTECGEKVVEIVRGLGRPEFLGVPAALRAHAAIARVDIVSVGVWSHCA